MKSHKEFKFNRISQVLLTSILSLISLTSHAGGEKGDAANTVYCDGSDPRFPQPGYYMLDYAIEESKNHSWHMENQDPIKNLELIASKLNEVVPLIMSKDKQSAYSLKNYNLLMFPEKINKWIATNKELHISELGKSSDASKSLLDEQLCKMNTIKQIVTYSSGDYFYNTSGYNEVIEAKIVKESNKDLGPLQKSILWTHELLRGANFSTKEIWKWVRVLHSTQFFTLDKFDLIEYLHKQNLLDADDLQLQRFYHHAKAASRRDRLSWAKQLDEIFQLQYAKVEKKFKLIDVVEDKEKCSALKDAKDYFAENNPNITNEKIQILYDFLETKSADSDVLHISFRLYLNSSKYYYGLFIPIKNYEKNSKCSTDQ